MHSSIANSVRHGLNRHSLKVGIEGFVVLQDAPGNAGELVGQRDGELVPVQSLRRRLEPRAEAISGPVVRWINSVRRYLLPRFEMRPRIDLPPVLYCRGTRPSQAPKSRPRSKASPVPIAATIPVEIIGPMPGTLISRWHVASTWLSFSISPVTVLMRSSSWHQSFVKTEEQAGHTRRYLVLLGSPILRRASCEGHAGRL
jgi:hypothetical protein